MGCGLIREATHGYIKTMAFARQLTDRRTLELAAFSLPAVAACLALLLVPHRHNTNHLVSVALPLETQLVIQPSEPTFPQVKTMPFDGLAPTAQLRKPDVAPRQPHAIIVQAGHTLWRIARETYGSGRDYPTIVSANRSAIPKPELIHPGQQLVLPDKKAN